MQIRVTSREARRGIELRTEEAFYQRTDRISLKETFYSANTQYKVVGPPPGFSLSRFCFIGTVEPIKAAMFASAIYMPCFNSSPSPDGRFWGAFQE